MPQCGNGKARKLPANHDGRETFVESLLSLQVHTWCVRKGHQMVQGSGGVGELKVHYMLVRVQAATEN